MELEFIQTLIDYHIDMTHRVWDSIDHLTEEQFLADDAYSRGSVRNLMVHLASTDRRWLAGLRNQEDVGHLNFEEYSTRAQAREIFENVMKDLATYGSTLTSADLNSANDKVAEPRWQVLLHLINHGTDHRATVLQRLYEFGAPTFDQDFILWIWRKQS
jgi:uncharacterized damage-inducible protein DinB